MGAASIADDEYFQTTIQTVIRNRALLTEGLKKSGFTVLDSRANFIFASPPDKDGKRLYSARISEFCRISVGDEKSVKTLLACVAEIYGR